MVHTGTLKALHHPSDGFCTLQEMLGHFLDVDDRMTDRQNDIQNIRTTERMKEQAIEQHMEW